MLIWDNGFSSAGDLGSFSAWESLKFLRFQSFIKLQKAWPSPPKQNHKLACGKLLTELGTCCSIEEVLILTYSRLIIFEAKWLLCLPLYPLKCVSFQLFTSNIFHQYPHRMQESYHMYSIYTLIFAYVSVLSFTIKIFKIYLVIVTCWKLAVVTNLFC